jgi:hypothetical protein
MEYFVLLLCVSTDTIVFNVYKLILFCVLTYNTMLSDNMFQFFIFQENFTHSETIWLMLFAFSDVATAMLDFCNIRNFEADTF